MISSVHSVTECTCVPGTVLLYYAVSDTEISSNQTSGETNWAFSVNVIIHSPECKCISSYPFHIFELHPHLVSLFCSCATVYQLHLLLIELPLSPYWIRSLNPSPKLPLSGLSLPSLLFLLNSSNLLLLLLLSSLAHALFSYLTWQCKRCSLWVRMAVICCNPRD